MIYGRSIGEEIRLRLREQKLTQKDLSEIIKRPTKTVNALVNGTKQITPETAVQLYLSIGGHPLFWLTLESQRQLERIGCDDYAYPEVILSAMSELTSRQVWKDKV